MIRVTPTIALHEAEIREEFVKSAGPGGQNVNKVATAVRLYFDVRGSASLPEAVRERLLRLAGRRVSSEGVLRVDAQRYRTQERNRQDARERLMALIRRAEEKPKVRRPTQPTQAEREKRLESKQRQREKKEKRRRVRASED